MITFTNALLLIATLNGVFSTDSQHTSCNFETPDWSEFSSNKTMLCIQEKCSLLTQHNFMCPENDNPIVSNHPFAYMCFKGGAKNDAPLCDYLLVIPTKHVPKMIHHVNTDPNCYWKNKTSILKQKNFKKNYRQ